MKLTSHNLKNGSSIIRFVQWNTQGTGMVNVFSPGDGGGEIMSIAGARAYWKKCVEQWGYKKIDSDKFVC